MFYYHGIVKLENFSTISCFSVRMKLDLVVHQDLRQIALEFIYTSFVLFDFAIFEFSVRIIITIYTQKVLIYHQRKIWSNEINTFRLTNLHFKLIQFLLKI